MGVVQLTERIKLELEKQIVVIENEQLEKTIEHIEALYRSKLRQNKPTQEKGTHDFKLSQDIVKAVEYFAEQNPNAVKDFQRKIDAYLKDLENSNLKDTQIRSSSVKLKAIRRLLYFVLGFPFFLFGIITSLVPFKLSGFISRRIKIREDFVGSINISVGMLVFLLIYLLEAVLLSNYTSNLVGVLFFVILYPMGLFTISYINSYYKFRGNIKYVTLFVQKSDVVSRLKREREELITELEKRKEEYLNQSIY